MLARSELLACFLGEKQRAKLTAAVIIIEVTPNSQLLDTRFAPSARLSSYTALPQLHHPFLFLLPLIPSPRQQQPTTTSPINPYLYIISPPHHLIHLSTILSTPSQWKARA
jgi:hypothetical protein